MGRPSNRNERRAEIVQAFARALARHGFAGATIAAVAAEADVSPGLVHHHFADKADLLDALLSHLLERFRQSRERREGGMDSLATYIDAALKLDARADVEAARCWVAVFAEAIRDPALFRRVRRVLDAELLEIERRGAGALAGQDASAILSFILGSLVFGAFAPRKTSGFAAPALHQFVETLNRETGAKQGEPRA